MPSSITFNQKFNVPYTPSEIRGRSPVKAFGGNHSSSGTVDPMAGAGRLRASRGLARGRPATAWPKSARAPEHRLRKLPYQFELDANPRHS
jgi:hypothetical protein